MQERRGRRSSCRERGNRNYEVGTDQQVKGEWGSVKERDVAGVPLFVGTVPRREMGVGTLSMREKPESSRMEGDRSS
jgi:hypothetical protein